MLGTRQTIFSSILNGDGIWKAEPVCTAGSHLDAEPIACVAGKAGTDGGHAQALL